MTFKIEMNSLQSILTKRGLQARGAVQQFLGSEFARRMDPRVPMRTGTTKNTVRILKGGEEIEYITPQSRRLYYNPQFNFNGAPQRGAYWFERTKNAEGAQIFTAAANIAGGSFKK